MRFLVGGIIIVVVLGGWVLVEGRDKHRRYEAFKRELHYKGRHRRK